MSATARSSQTKTGPLKKTKKIIVEFTRALQRLRMECEPWILRIQEERLADHEAALLVSNPHTHLSLLEGLGLQQMNNAVTAGRHAQMDEKVKIHLHEINEAPDCDALVQVLSGVSDAFQTELYSLFARFLIYFDRAEGLWVINLNLPATWVAPDGVRLKLTELNLSWRRAIRALDVPIEGTAEQPENGHGGQKGGAGVEAEPLAGSHNAAETAEPLPVPKETASALLKVEQERAEAERIAGEQRKNAEELRLAQERAEIDAKPSLAGLKSERLEAEEQRKSQAEREESERQAQANVAELAAEAARAEPPNGTQHVEKKRPGRPQVAEVQDWYRVVRELKLNNKSDEDIEAVLGQWDTEEFDLSDPWLLGCRNWGKSKPSWKLAWSFRTIRTNLKKRINRAYHPPLNPCPKPISAGH